MLTVYHTKKFPKISAFGCYNPLKPNVIIPMSYNPHIMDFPRKSQLLPVVYSIPILQSTSCLNPTNQGVHKPAHHINQNQLHPPHAVLLRSVACPSSLYQPCRGPRAVKDSPRLKGALVKADRLGLLKYPVLMFQVGE